MTIDIGAVFMAVAIPPFTATVWRAAYRITRMAKVSFWGDWMASAAVLSVLFMWQDEWLAAAVAGANLVVGAVFWWLSRRRRKRAPKLAGAKSKARLAALVRRSREASKPRPVLRPVPGSAR
jgi:hypothetical protein